MTSPVFQLVVPLLSDEASRQAKFGVNMTTQLRNPSLAYSSIASQYLLTTTLLHVHPAYIDIMVQVREACPAWRNIKSPLCLIVLSAPTHVAWTLVGHLYGESSSLFR